MSDNIYGNCQDLSKSYLNEITPKENVCWPDTRVARGASYCDSGYNSVDEMDDVDDALVKGIIRHIPYNLLAQLSDDATYLHLWGVMGGYTMDPDTTVQDILGPLNTEEALHGDGNLTYFIRGINVSPTEADEEDDNDRTWASVAKETQKMAPTLETEVNDERKMTVLTKGRSREEWNE